jgi:HEAT repeat protein
MPPPSLLTEINSLLPHLEYSWNPFSHRTKEAALVAAQTLDQLLRTCPAEQLAILDPALRHIYPFARLRTSDLEKSTFTYPTILGLASCNANGYIREAAVQRLADLHTDGAELPFLILRLNDWVPQVSDPARHAIRQRFTPTFAPAFVRCLPLIFALQGKQRNNQQGIFISTLRFLQREESRPAMQDALQSANPRVRRLALRVLAETPGGGPLDLLQQQLETPDPALRLAAARAVRKLLHGDSLRALLLNLTADKVAVIRREALTALAEQFPEAAEPVLRAALLDPHVSIRDAARFHLVLCGQRDFSEFYRAAVQRHTAKPLEAALAGLGETGAPTDTALIQPFASHERIALRRTAVRALARLTPKDSVQPFLTALQDPSRGVAKIAARILEDRASNLDAQLLWPLYTSGSSPDLIVHLLGKISAWDAAPHLIQVATSNNKPLAATAHRALTTWAKNPRLLYTRPTPTQAQSLAQSLSQHASALDPLLKKRFAEALQFTQRPIAPQ